jgi:hypothetical protein
MLILPLEVKICHRVKCSETGRNTPDFFSGNFRGKSEVNNGDGRNPAQDKKFWRPGQATRLALSSAAKKKQFGVD